MSTTTVLIAACTILLSIVSFFLANFYIKVEQIAKDISHISTSLAVTDIKITSLDKRVTDIEAILKKTNT